MQVTYGLGRVCLARCRWHTIGGCAHCFCPLSCVLSRPLVHRRPACRRCGIAQQQCRHRYGNATRRRLIIFVNARACCLRVKAGFDWWIGRHTVLVRWPKPCPRAVMFCVWGMLMSPPCPSVVDALDPCDVALDTSPSPSLPSIGGSLDSIVVARSVCCVQCTIR